MNSGGKKLTLFPAGYEGKSFIGPNENIAAFL